MDQLVFGGWATSPAQPEFDNQNDFDALLQIVLVQARSVEISVSKSISQHVLVNKRAKSRFGSCNKVGDRYIIELSQLLLIAPEHACLQVLAHEILHTCDGCRNHGARWKSYARRMNAAFGYDIARTDSYEQLGILGEFKPRYVVICTKCGLEYPRLRASALTRNPGQFRCKCGGKLKNKM